MVDSYYILSISYLIIYINVYIYFFHRRFLTDITLCSQISNNSMNTVQPINDAEVEIYFNIENMAVS